MKTKTIYVHAWEAVNVFPRHPRRLIEPATQGFEFYYDPLKASAAFKTGIAGRLEASPVNTADFYFELDVPKHATVRTMTTLAEAARVDRCALTKARRVGENVLAYWKSNRFKMGSKAPARA